MARAPNNFSYQSPVASIGDSLARAIFGDPAAAQAQATARQQADLRAAQAERERAAAGYDTARTTGVNTANAAQSGLPELMANWVQSQQPAPPPPTVDSPEFGNFDQPLNIPAAPDKMGALAALIGGIGQMQGDKIDPTKIMGSAAAFAGGDELARRGMVAQGNSPTAAFAITPERADEIAGIGNAADLAQALGVAQINHQNDIPVAQIGARSRENVALTNNRDDIPVAQIGAAAKGGGAMSRGERNNNPGNLEFGPFAQSMGATSSDGRFAIFPDFQSGVKAQEALLGGRSYVGGGVNTIAAIINRYAPPSDGNPVGNYANYISRATGIPVNQPITAAQVPAVAAAMRQFETGSQGTGTASKPAAGAKPPKPPKPITPAQQTALNDSITAQLQQRGLNPHPGDVTRVQTWAAEAYQQSGNIVGAATAGIERALQQGRTNAAAKAKARPTGPAAPANGQSNFPAPRMGAMSVASERSEAMAAIAKGAPRAVVAARFKQKTGQAL